MSSSSQPNAFLDGPYTASRTAWNSAKMEAEAAIEKLKAAIAKTRDARAVEAGAALNRILRRLPDMGCVLEALAEAEETGSGEAASLKEQARKTAQLASYYLRSDRLAAAIRENPFVPVSVDKIFGRAFQTIQRELK
jgi:hypothetical protein